MIPLFKGRSYSTPSSTQVPPLPSSLTSISNIWNQFFSNPKKVKNFQSTILSFVFGEEHFSEKLKKLMILNGGDSVCRKILKSNNKGFKCLECGIDRCSIICEECFEPELHVGHRTVLQMSSNGCCDCGVLLYISFSFF